MKVINFTAVEILPALLSKAKIQMIRLVDILSSLEGKTLVEKLPRFKVGDKVKLLWNQRSKYTKFCSNCGKGEDKDITIAECNHCHSSIIYFNKHIGDAEITEVFKIEMWNPNCSKTIDGSMLLSEPSKLAEFDGFASVEAMFDYFDKKYDLSKPKAFWVYRWIWSN